MTSVPAPAEDPPHRPRFRGTAWSLFKWGLFLLVAVFVSRQVSGLWNQAGVEKIRLTPGWLVAAVLVSIVAWLPPVAYWRMLLRMQGMDLGWRDVARAYYCSHLGKYVPGKATVLLIRAGLLRARGVHPAAAVLTSTYEVFVGFTAAGFLGLSILPWIIDRDQAEQLLGFALPSGVEFHWSMTAVALVLNVLGLHVCSKYFSRIVTRLAPRAASDEPVVLPNPTLSNSSGWFVLLMAGWCLHGLCLGLTARSVAGAEFSWAQWPLWTAAIALASLIGFFAVFAPAGLFVREGLLIKLLSLQLEGPEAVATAVLMRGVGLTGELLAGSLLYYAISSPRTEAAD